MNARVQKLASTLREGEAALIWSPTNRRYFTDFDASDGALWITRENAGFLTDFRYIEAAERQIGGIACTQSNRLLHDVAAVLMAQGVRTVYIEDETVTLALRRQMVTALDKLTLCGDETLCKRIWELRRVKDEQELSCIKRAQALTDEGFAYILPRLTLGRSEREVALDMEMYMRGKGADGVAFGFIVASGENSAMPHAVPSDRRLQKGDFVTMDFGATVDGYRSDMTRTVALGSISEEQRTVYETVLSAQKAALSGLRAGMSGQDGDALARDVIKAAGYGAAFGHSTGHGVGLDIHELPRLSPNAFESLRVGEVVTVEPGIYLEGRFGVRIEDMVRVTAEGCEDLTHSPKELLVL